MKNEKLEKTVKDLIAKAVCADLEIAAKKDIEIIAEDEKLINYLEELRNSPNYEKTQENLLNETFYNVIKVCISERVYLMEELPNAFGPSIIYSLYTEQQIEKQYNKARKIILP